jgi:hypothetical protein
VIGILQPSLEKGISDADLVRTRTAAFALFYQTIGGAVIIPLYYLSYIYSSTTDGYYLSGRNVHHSYAKALLPATVLGYLIPTIAMYLPWGNINITQSLTAFWQPAPVLVNVLLWTFSIPLSFLSTTSSGAADVEYLKRIYKFAGVVAAVAHIATVFICLISTNPKVSLTSVFLPNKETRKTSTAYGLHWIYQWDWWGVFVPSLLWCWIAASQVLKLSPKRSNSMSSITALGWILAMAVIAGPGASMAAVWYWREEMMLKIEEGPSKTLKKQKRR